MKKKIAAKIKLVKTLNEKASRHKLTEVHIKAAGLLAQGILNGKQIAQRCRVPYVRLNSWKSKAFFMEEVQRQISVYASQQRGQNLGIRERRIAMRDELFEALQYIRQKRGENADAEMKKMGGLTGLIVAEAVRDNRGKVVGKVYQVDHPTVTQMRQLAIDQAREVGEWNADKAGGNTSVTIVLTPEERGWAGK